MGGKIKQRTKGNTKPSSSGRAAELLSRDGTTGFIGFGNTGSTSDNASLQFVPVNTDPDTAVHVDFQVIMKKLTKRDAVTKLKAVQEFGELCKTCAMDAVLGVLPYWPRLYNKLAMEIDYRVREATQNAMNQMASRVGRNLAPHLKSVMGVWLCSQCDCYSPVATAAQKAFSVAFSDSKQSGVLEFCKKEIIEYLIDNLTKQTADTFSDPEVVEEKDRVTKFIRVISSSLLAYARFLSSVGEEVNTELVPYTHNLMSEKKFWKFGRHKSPQVRSAFFQLVTVYCQTLPDLVKSFSSSVCPIVLGSLEEADASVSSYVWEAALQVLSIIQDCWQHVNIEKAVLPKFWNFLSNAAYGNANVVMVSVMPFLSKLPDEVVCPGSGFTSKLFNKLIEGLNQHKVQQSPSECKAVVSVFMDCVSYVLSPRTWKIDINDDELHEVRTYAVDQLINVIDLSFSPKSTLSSTALYERVHDLLRILTNMDNITSHFWDSFDRLVIGKLIRSDDKGNQVAFQHILNCLCCLKSPGIKSKKSLSGPKVRFKDPNEDYQEKTHDDHALQQKQVSDIDVDTLYGGKLLNTVNKSLQSCLGFVLTQNCEAHLMLLTQLLKEFYSATLLKDLLNTVLNKDTRGVLEIPEESSEYSKHCIDELVLSLLQKVDRACKDSWLMLLLELLFVLFVHVEEKDQTIILENVFHVNSSSKLLYFITNEIFKTELFNKISEVHGLEIGKRSVELLKTCFNETTSTADDNVFTWMMFDFCFNHKELLEFFFTKELLDDVFNIFHGDLADDRPRVSRHSCICQIVEKFVQNTGVNSVKFGRPQNLLYNIGLDIFRLRLHNCCPESSLVNCCESLMKAASFDDEWRNQLSKQITYLVQEYFNSEERTKFEKFYTFTETSLGLIQALTAGNNMEFLATLKQVVPSETEWDMLRLTTSQQTLGQILLFLEGQLTFIEPLVFGELSKDGELTVHQKITFFLVNALKHGASNDNMEYFDPEDEWIIDVGLELLWMKECLHLTSCHSHDPIQHSFPTFVSNYNTKLQPLLDSFNTSENNSLLPALFNKSYSSGGLWSLTLKSYPKDNASTKILCDSFITKCQNGELRQSVLQTFQCLLAEETSIYNLKIIVEIYSKKLSEIDTGDLLSVVFCLTLISCAFERWICLTKDNEVASLECHLTLLETLEIIRTRKDTIEHLLLFSCSVNIVEMSIVSLNMALIRIFKMAVANFSKELSSDQWDMVLCSMLDWLQCCNESDLTILHVSAFTNQLCQLIKAVCVVLSDEQATLPNEHDDDDVQLDFETPLSGTQLIQKLANEWKEFFSNSACDNLLRILLTIADTDVSNDSKLFLIFHHLSESLSSPCAYFTLDNLKEYTTLKTSDDSKWHAVFITKFIPYLESSFSAFQITSYRLLLKVIPVFAVNKGAQRPSSDKEDQEDDISSPPPAEIMSIITNSQSKLLDVFSEAQVPFGETLVMTDDIEALHITRSYLLAWKLLLEYFVKSSEECRVRYATFLRRGKHLYDLLEVLFRVLPKKQSDVKRVLEGSGNLEEKCLLDEEFVHGLAFETYYDLLRTLPALVRQWWNNLDKTKASIVERYTTLNVSPLLCEKELQNVQKTSVSSDNMEIATRSSTREVIAYYKIEEISIELMVGLSSSHPLGAVNVNGGKRVGVKINQWRLWMMQLTTFLMHQNGSIIEGLMLWKRNVDKKFEGVEDCMICFSVIHGSNYSLPKLSCKTCKKKFHSACLYRWFNTSQNSTCPLCRNLF